MARTLGIDLGTNSIGWAIVDKNATFTTLVDKGVCIFQEGVARDSSGEKPAVQERTNARASRRHNFRRRLRKIELLKILVENRFCPYIPPEALLEWKEHKRYPLDEDFLTWQCTDDLAGKNPYADRHKALHERLNFDIQEDRWCFGRAMYHIVQRRGFLSNRKDRSEESEEGAVKIGITGLTKAMREAGCTFLGDYFYQIYGSSKIRCQYTDRLEHYKAEFNEICRVQCISEELAAKLEKAIFYQRPLKSQRGTVGRCTFEKDKPRCPISHPKFEEFRMWQFINSIKVIGPDDVEPRTLRINEVEQIIPLFLRRSKPQFDFEDIAKKIAGKGNYGFITDPVTLPYRFNYRIKVSVSGCQVLSGLLAFVGRESVYDNWDGDLAALYSKASGKSVDAVVNDIWHVLYTYDNEESLTDWLMTNLQATRDKAELLSKKTRIPEGYSSLSLKAISKILPYLKEGKRYDKAVMLAGLPKAFNIEQRQDAALMAQVRRQVIAILDNGGNGGSIKAMLAKDFGAPHPERIYHPSMMYSYQKVTQNNGHYRLGSPRVPSIKNPMAMRALFRLRALVNELLAKGMIDSDTRVNIEFARGLNNANMRKAIETFQRSRETLHRKYAEAIQDTYRLVTGKDIIPTDTDILKYELWEEQQHKCLYTGKEISITDFIGSSATFDIEHTVPRSRGGDSSLMNKTLCQNKFNREVKRAKLPSELSNHQEILARIESLDWYRKIEDLRIQIECRSRDSRNAATKAAKDSALQRLNELRIELDYRLGKYKRFTMTEIPEGFSNRQGVDIGIIGRYAKLYLQTVFGNTFIVKGMTTADFRKAWGLQDEYEKKSRDSHFHHCIDAITIACIGKNEYDRWKWYAEKCELYSYGEMKRPLFEKPWPTFTEDVKSMSEEILIAHDTPDNMGKRSHKRIRVRGRLVRDCDGKCLYQTGDTARGSLNKATFYGAIEHDGEIKYVVRKPLGQFKDSDIKNIVDDSVREKVQSAVNECGFKTAMAGIIWMNEEKGIPITKVRVFVPSVTSPVRLKRQRNLSDKFYKRNYYVTNDSNYCMAIYGAGTKKPSFKLVSNLDAARQFAKGVKDIVPLSDDNDLPLSYVLKTGTMVLFYDQSPQELHECCPVELSRRLYKVTGMSSMTIQGKYTYGTIILRSHLEARMSKDLTIKKGVWKKGEAYRPVIGLQHTQLRCYVEDYDFELSVDGKISFLHPKTI